MANEQAAQKKQAEVEVTTRPIGEEQQAIKAQEILKKWWHVVAQVWADEKLFSVMD